LQKKNFKKTSGLKLKSAPQAIASGRTNNTSESYGATPAIWDHTESPATWHR